MIKDERPIVVGIGEALLDCFKKDDGSKSEELGGAPLIFAYHAAKSHCRGLIVSAIGMNDDGDIDKNGKTIIDELTRLNLWGESEEYVFKVKNRCSGIVEVTDKKKPEYNIKTDAAWTDILWSEKDEDKKDKENKLVKLAKKTSAVYFGPLASHCSDLSYGTSKQAIEIFIKNVPDDEDHYKIFDINLRDNPNEEGEHKVALYNDILIRNYIDDYNCNVIKANKIELDRLGEIYKIKEKEEEIDSNTLAETLMKERCPKVKILILTKGKEGSTIFWRDTNDESTIFSQSIHISVEPENTVGAGDAMAGTFIGELLHGRSIPEAHYLAARRSDLVCKEGKSMPDIPVKDFFFSYSKNDNVVVDLFYHKFKNNGYTTVYKDNPELLPGTNIGNDIANAIANCKVFVYFSSKTANESPNVLDEIKMAIRKKKDILIIMLDDSLYPKKVRKYLEPIYHERFNMYVMLHNSKYDMFNELDVVFNNIMKFYKNRTK